MKRNCVFICSAMILLCVVTQPALGAATLTSIKIQPTADKLLAGQTLKLKVVGSYSDGSKADVTSKVTWVISNTSVVKVSTEGVVSIVDSVRSAGGPNRQGNRSRQGESGPNEGMGNMPPDLPGNFEGAGGPPPGEGMGGPGMPPPDMPGGFEGAGGPPPGEGSMPPSRQNRQQDPGGPGMGGPGGSSKMPTDVTVTINAILEGVTSAPVSLTVLSTEGPATYSQSGSTASKANQKITASDKNTSAVKIADNSVFMLSDSTILTSGDTTNMEYSSFYGLNAGVLALSGSKIKMTNGSITTTGTGANGAFAVGQGTVVELINVKIDCTAGGAHGVDATIDGTVICTDVDIKTAGNGAAAAISTDRGGGTIDFTRGSVLTTGTRSPAVYSTGNITVTDAKLESVGSEGVVIEGKNSVTLNNVNLSCLKQCGAMLYQSFSGDAGIGTSVFTMNGGSFIAAEGPMFYVTNTNAIIELKDNARLTPVSGILVKVGGGQWGRMGANGGELSFKADGVVLTGNIVCDSISTVAMTLQNKTTFKGAVNAENTAKTITLALDAGSIWDVTANSYLTSLTDEDRNFSNIRSNGRMIYYDAKAEANKSLEGKTITLPGGGKLMPR